MTTRDPVDLVRALADRPGRAGRLVHLEVLPARAGRRTPWPGWVDPALRDALVATGIPEPWEHQVRAAEAAYDGRHVVVATGTASGKSLCYLLPALTALAGARGAKGQRGASVLYLSPTKALARDQLAAVAALELPGLRLAAHDGDSSSEEREWTRDHAEYVATNPDMLHASLLPDHVRWSSFLSRLRYVVVDECHHYRGVFGAHVALVLRRLRRVAALHGADPTFVLASATVAEPAEVAARLTGLPVVAVTEDASPRGRMAVGLWEPPLTEGGQGGDQGSNGENGAPVRRSASAETADLMTDLVLDQVRTLAFVRSHSGVETVASIARRQLGEVQPGLERRVAAYRGGYLPEERRALERALRDDELWAVAATNALELGIDLRGLDAVVVAGFPGTRAALWQQLGRAGRRGADALGLLVARDDPLDTFLVHHPETLLGAPVETNVFDPQNPHVLAPHLCAAAAESPLTEDDLALFGPGAAAAVAALTESGHLRRRPRGWYWPHRARASSLADIRSSGGRPVTLAEAGTGRVLGTVDRAAAPATVHRGAVYVHQGETWEVQALDLAEGVAMLERAAPDYSTVARELTDVRILAEHDHHDWGAVRLCVGEVEVSSQVVAFLKRRHPDGVVIGQEPLDLPEQMLETTGVWWTVAADALADAHLADQDLPGAAHAAEHAAIGLLPLFATCDRWDIGGVSTALHPDTGRLTVVVYDGHPGGAGFAERGFAVAQDWLAATREAILACECATGCPSCVQSPKCGNQNNPLDKAGAARLLGLVLAGAGGVPLEVRA